MLWWIEYERTVSIIDDDILSELTKAGVPQEFIQKVNGMKGTYATNDEYYAKVQTVLGQSLEIHR